MVSNDRLRFCGRTASSVSLKMSSHRANGGAEIKVSDQIFVMMEASVSACLVASLFKVLTVRLIVIDLSRVY